MCILAIAGFLAAATLACAAASDAMPDERKTPAAYAAAEAGRDAGDRIGALIDRENARHLAACQARYPSYDVRTDTFEARPGVRVPCRL
ncbi:MAG TPA: BA14K family protein [Phenylobacterium sp.]